MKHLKNNENCRCEDCLAKIEVSKAEDAMERGIYETEMWRMNRDS